MTADGRYLPPLVAEIKAKLTDFATGIAEAKVLARDNFDAIDREGSAMSSHMRSSMMSIASTASTVVAGVKKSFEGLSVASLGLGALGAGAGAGLGLAGVAAVAEPALKRISAAMQAETAAQDGTKASAKKLQEALGQLSPAEAAMLGQVDALKTRFGAWQHALEPGLMSTFTNALQTANNVLSATGPLVAGVESVLGNLSGRIANLTASGGFASFLHQAVALLPQVQATVESVGSALGKVGSVATSLAGPALSVISTLATSIGTLIAEAQPGLQAFIGGLASFASDVLPAVASALGPVVDALGNGLGEVLAEVGPVLAALAPQIGQLLVGAIHALVPLLSAAVTVIGRLLPAINPLIPLVVQLAQTLGTGLADTMLRLLPVVEPLIVDLVQLAGPILRVVDAALASKPVLDALLIGLLALLNPIAGVGAAVGLLAANWSQIWGDIKQWTADAVDFIKDHLVLIMTIALGPLGLAIGELLTHWQAVWGGIKTAISDAKDFIKSMIDTVVGFFTGLPGRITSAVAHLWDGITAGFKAAVNWVIGAWDAIPHFHIHIPHVPGTSIGGDLDIGLPHIPMLAKGGDVMRSGLAVVGENGPELLNLGAGAGVRPLAGGGVGGGDVHIHLNGPIVGGSASDAKKLAAFLGHAMREVAYKHQINGQPWAISRTGQALTGAA